MEKDIIYIAGAPGAYPLEYYDLDTESYQGVVPELLRRFSAQSRYDVRYYAPGKEDQRDALSASQQVDIVSCPEGTGAVRRRTEADILLLEDGGDGQPVTLCLLDVAPAGLEEDLRAFLAGIGPEELTGMVVQAARSDPPQSQVMIRNVFFGLTLCILILTAALTGAIVSGRKKLKRLRQTGELDPVTGLGNRAWLARCCQTTINDRNRVLYTMFCFSYAPAAISGDGNAAVRNMASVLQDCVSGTDILARISDACFAFLRLSVGEQAAMEWMTPVLGRLRKEVLQAGGDAQGVTVGAYPLKAEDRELDEVISRAVRSAHMARQKESGCQFFGNEAFRAVQEERRLRTEVRNALQSREFQIYIQFYVDAFTGQAVGGEVIPLWEHPAKGFLPAEQWLPMMELEGISAQLDEYVLERICAMLDTLRQNGRENFFFLYCLSEGSLRAENLRERWAEIAGGYQFNRRLMLFSVPQRVLERDFQAVFSNIETIQSLEMRLVLDGFNGQLTALAQAETARFCGVKLKDVIPGQKQSDAVLRAAVRAGHEMELAVLAEGADTAELAVRLRKLGCDMLRGELYARPLPAWEAVRKLVGRTVEKEELML